MRSAISKLFILSCFLMVTPAVASNKVGNGGNIVLCDPNNINQNSLLDFFEAKLEVSSEKEHEALSIARATVKKLGTIAPALAEHFQSRLNSVMNEIEWIEASDLSSIDDSHHYLVPRGCQVVQAAIRQTIKLSSEKRFLIQKEAWDALNPTHQAGLLMHELIYEYLAKVGETNSMKARKLNAFIFNPAATTKKDFWVFVQKLELPIYPRH
jgi:hypothetical protein